MIRHDAEDRRGYLGNASGATWPLVGCTAEKDHQSAKDHPCNRQSTAKLSNISVSLTSLNDQWQDWEVQWEQHPHQQIYHRPLESFESSKSPTPGGGYVCTGRSSKFQRTFSTANATQFAPSKAVNRGAEACAVRGEQRESHKWPEERGAGIPDPLPDAADRPSPTFSTQAGTEHSR